MSSAPIDRTVFLPGATTDGHYQIELECNACHTESFSDLETMQEACIDCHGAELELANDSHPQSKFMDPRNADRVAVLDARWCVTCHQEHQPEITSTMGLSLPTDYCYRCHEDVGEERPTHADLPFESCSSGGCHNFHDNRALYEDFLVAHRDEPMHQVPASVPMRELRPWAIERGFAQPVGLLAAQHDAPPDIGEVDRWVDEWADTSHAKSGVNCTGCHAPEGSAWLDSPALETCATCHAAEHQGFSEGRHGMRLDAGLPPMRSEMARLPMHEASFDTALECNTCHPAHEYDTRKAAVDSCLACHADEHSDAFEGSPHAALWQQELAGSLPEGHGVSCATCHLPRIESADAHGRVLVAHNQNAFLRPNEKMVRSVCMQCHGLGFSLDSLADPALVRTNFRGRPAREVESIHFATELRWELEGRTPPWKNEEETEK